MTQAQPNLEIFAELQAAAHAIPQMRTGQLLAAIGEVCLDLHGMGLWDVSDAQLLEAIEKFQRGFLAATGPLENESRAALTTAGVANLS
jgi:hypothetical protein